MLQQIRTLAADALLDRLFDILTDAGIPFVVVKGPAVARLHPDGWPRPYADIDILVDPRMFSRALSRLLESGFEYPITSQAPWPWFDRYCREGLNLAGTGDVDVHHHLAPWAFGRALRSNEVMSQAIAVTVHERPVLMASPEHSAVIAVLHILNDLWKGHRGLNSWRDLIAITRRVDPVSLQQVFESIGLGWLFGVAVGAVQVQLPGVLDGVDCEHPPVPLRYAWRLRGLGWDRVTSLSRQRLAWTTRLPLPQAAAFVIGSGLPSRRYIRDRHGSYRNYWHQAWTEAMSTFGGADHRMDKSPVGGDSAC